MDIITILFIVSLAAITASSIVDLRIREVPDWISFGLIFSGLGLRFIFSVLDADYMILLEGFFGLGIFFALSALLFYSGQWGGGDSKLLMGLGSTMGLSLNAANNVYLMIASGVCLIVLFGLNFKDPLTYAKTKLQKRLINITNIVLSILVVALSFIFIDFSSNMIYFMLNLLIVGGIYGTIWTIGSILKNIKTFNAHFKEISPIKGMHALIALGLLVLFALLYPFFPLTSVTLITLTVSFCFMMIVFFGIKAAELTTMIKDQPIKKLTEGDWVVEDVKVKGKLICGPDDLGLTKEQIKTLEKSKLKSIKIKEGIPFVPSFFFGFILTYWSPTFFIDLVVRFIQSSF